MEPGSVTPLLDFFRRGQVDRDIRLMAAQGVLGLRPVEQQGMLELLADDPDADIAEAARASLRVIRETADADACGASPSGSRGEPERLAPRTDDAAAETSALKRIAALTPAERLSLAMRGTREERAILIRDPNKIVAVAVLSSPKITDAEVEGIAKMANVSEDVLRIIGQARAWMKNYAIMSALTRNPKTPVAMALNLLPRLIEKDVKGLASDRNIPDVVRLAAKRRLMPGA
jgi:hypothetical protein